MNFFAQLEARCREADSLLVVGLDPHPGELPANSPAAARDFCLCLIEATAPYAAAFKPNAAFFEAHGPEGIRALQQVIAAVPQGIPVLLDAKRGDIASTARAYAAAAFETLGAGAVTLNPYLGRDSLEPFLAAEGKGIFLLCKTSNPGASDFQDLTVLTEAGEMMLYEQVARMAQAWDPGGRIGLVVGATQPDALRRVRAAAPDLWLLAPGVGAQGGELEIALRLGLRADGLGLLLPVSRAISRAEDPGRAARDLREQINIVRRQVSVGRAGEGGEAAGGPVGEIPQALLPLATGLLEAGCVQFGSFTLKSGLQSPVYIDLRRLAGYPPLLALAAEAYLPLLRGLTFDRLAGLPYAALPIATAIGLRGGWPLVYPRKESKSYGTKAEIEGPFQAGERVVVIDDLATTGESKFEAINKLSAAGLQVQDVVVLIDRQSGAAEALAERGYRLHAVFTFTQLLDTWERTGSVPRSRLEAARDFIRLSRAAN